MPMHLAGRYGHVEVAELSPKLLRKRGGPWRQYGKEITTTNPGTKAQIQLGLE